MIDKLRELLTTQDNSNIRQQVIELLMQVQRTEDLNDSEFHLLIARAFRHVDDQPPDAEWCETIVRLTTEARDEFVRQRAMFFDLDSLPFQAPDLIDVTLEALRRRLAANDAVVSVFAARAMLAFGVKWADQAHDIEHALTNVGLSASDRAHVLALAGAVDAFERTELHNMMDGLLAAKPEYSNELGNLVAHHGDRRHWWFLEQSFISMRDRCSANPNDRDLATLHRTMGCILVFGRRRLDLHHAIESLTVEYINTSVMFGWEHYIYRFYDAPAITQTLTKIAIEGFTGKKNVLFGASLVKNLNRPAHLEATLEMRQDLWPSAAAELKQPIVQCTGSDGIMQTSESLAKESALLLASRIGIPQLVDWEVEALRTEKVPFLVKRLAEDCMYWSNSSFLASLENELKVAGPENPIYLIDEFAGFLDPGDRALEKLLDADGRVGEDDVLQHYADSLGYLAASEGSCSRLTKCIVDTSQPEWRRRACVYAIGQAIYIFPDVEMDWAVVSDVVADAVYPEWCGTSLAVAVATHHAGLFRSLADEAGDVRLESTRACLAYILAGTHIDHVIKRLAPFRSSASADAAPLVGDSAYAALCVGHLYNRSYLDDKDILEFCHGGLHRHVGDVFRAIEALRHEELNKYLADYTIEHNASWVSTPGLWHLLARLSPERLTEPLMRDCASAAPPSSLRAYLDVLIRAPIADTSDLPGFFIELSLSRERSVSWHAARAAGRIVPTSINERIETLAERGEKGIRAACEHYMWSDEWDLGKAREIAGKSRFTSAHDYVDHLDEVKQQIEWAVGYSQRVVMSETLLEDWLYVQAILGLPSEDALDIMQNHKDGRAWSPAKGRAWYLRRFLAQNIEKKLKKNRENLWSRSRLPGEEATARWC